MHSSGTFGGTLAGGLSGSSQPRLFAAVLWVTVTEPSAFCSGLLLDRLPSLGNLPRRGAQNKNFIGFGSVTRLHSEGVHVKVIRRNDRPQKLLSHQPVSSREVFYFYDKNTGVTHFHVEAGPDGQFPVDQAAGLLAMHCVVRGQTPTDYAVMVQAEDNILLGLNERANKLLEAGRAVHSQVRLTRREEEVLAGVTNSLSNKEIATNLNLSERTVKFHVSSLLAKFQVRGRMELVRETSAHSLGVRVLPRTLATGEVRPYPAAVKSYMPPQRTAAVVPLPKRQLMA